jgi:hypothetical protein
MMDHDDRSPDTASEAELLLARYAALVDRLDPVPREAEVAAQAAFAARDLDLELADLLADSLLDSEERAALVRAGEAPRELSFGSAQLRVEVQVTARGPGRVDLRIQLVPPGPAEIVVENRDHDTQASGEADWTGSFVLFDQRPGRTRLRCRPADGDDREVATEWTRL